MAGWCSAVGWNCTNSTSAVGTPARSAMATPSPVDSAGLVVTEKSWPAPPVASTTWSARTSTGPCRAARRQGQHARAAAALDQQVERRTTPRARRWPSGTVAATSARSTSAPVAAPPACTTRAGSGRPRGPAPAAPVASRSNSTPSAISSCDAARALVDEDAHRLLVAQAGAGRQRVGEVQVGRVLVGAEHRGDAALGPARGGLRQRALGQHAERQRRRRPAGTGQPHRGRQAGDATPEDQDVEGSGPGPGGHAGSFSVSSASRRADTSSITRLRPSTCTTRGTYASSSARS